MTNNFQGDIAAVVTGGNNTLNVQGHKSGYCYLCKHPIDPDYSAHDTCLEKARKLFFKNQAEKLFNKINLKCTIGMLFLVVLPFILWIVILVKKTEPFIGIVQYFIMFSVVMLIVINDYKRIVVNNSCEKLRAEAERLYPYN